MNSEDALDRSEIAAHLGRATLDALGSLEVLAEVDSTNDCLRAAEPPEPGLLKVVLAEHQVRGRGRRGRRWVSPRGAGVYLSAGWTFPGARADLPALSLAAGVAACRALSSWNPAGLGLKWPNDILVGDAKLGGLLVEARGEGEGPVPVVIGVGINVDPVGDLADRFDTIDHLRPIGLRSVVPGGEVSRNELAAALIEMLRWALPEFEASGFAPFADEWRRRDVMAGRAVTVRDGASVRTGTSLGIDDFGSLLLDDGRDVMPLVSGEVSLRATTESPVA